MPQHLHVHHSSLCLCRRYFYSTMLVHTKAVWSAKNLQFEWRCFFILHTPDLSPTVFHLFQCPQIFFAKDDAHLFRLCAECSASFYNNKGLWLFRNGIFALSAQCRYIVEDKGDYVPERTILTICRICTFVKTWLFHKSVTFLLHVRIHVNCCLRF